MKIKLTILCLLLAGSTAVIGSADAAEPLPIDPLWQSPVFRKAFTASYGVDARIEPRLTTDEKAVLDSVAAAMADKDRETAIDKLTGSPLLSDSSALIFNLGNLRFEEGKTDDAIENFEKAIELYPNFRDAHRNLAVAQVQSDKFDEAEPHLRRAIELGASDGITFGLLGYCHVSAGRHQAALQAYRMAQLTMPDELQWQYGEAQALIELGAAAEAESLFAGLLERRADDVGLWLRQADVWIRSTQPEKAIANLEFANRLKPLAAAELASLGHLYLEQRLPDQALRCYLGAIDTGVDPVLDGLEYLCAYRDFEQATKLSARFDDSSAFAEESDRGARLERAKALIDLESEDGDVQAGVQRVEALLNRNPLDGDALLLLAAHFEKSAERERALMLLEQAAQVDATRAEALFRHGKMLVEDRRYREGLRLIDESLQLKARPALDDYLATVRRFADGEP